jgi:hypothetical protein
MREVRAERRRVVSQQTIRQAVCGQRNGFTSGFASGWMVVHLTPRACAIS